MSVLTRPILAWKAARQLGLEQVSLYAYYRLGLISGQVRRQTSRPTPWQPVTGRPPVDPLPLADGFATAYREWMANYPAAQDELLAEAEEISAGAVRKFGGPAAPLSFDLPAGCAQAHWTTCTERSSGSEDIKFLWEPARFGWVYPLARAYLLTNNDAYAQNFWQYTGRFLDANPPYLGPNWMSAQEAGLRILAFAFALQTFRSSPQSTPERTRRLLAAAAAHAERIPPTLVYARSQNNNHLLTEAAGLLTAARLCQGHPHADRWQKTGLHWLEHGLRQQIEADGTYSQHSTNYHRLMLQNALWAWAAGQAAGTPLAADVLNRLAAATTWLLDKVDLKTGQALNLGSNDGAYILPLAAGGFSDYRPVLQAAARAFFGRAVLPPGPWDEFWLWLTGHAPASITEPLPAPVPQTARLENDSSWAALRAVHFRARPAHADQLHVDLWLNGQPLTLDAGTYRYNAAPPWDNRLAFTCVHNTVSVDEQNQMLRGGKFLWLDWAQARVIARSNSSITAEHNGYRRLGILHRRTLTAAGAGHWQVDDLLQPAGEITREHIFTLHWLLPDGPYILEHGQLRLETSQGWLQIAITAGAPGQSAPASLELIRAGQSLTGSGAVAEILGWYSPTYGVKQPALALITRIHAPAPLVFTTRFTLPGG